MSLRDLGYDFLTVVGAAIGRRPLCGPRVVQLNISDRCNLACVICNQSCFPQGGFMPYEKALSVVGELYGLGLREVFYHGIGEPFLHPHIGDLFGSVSRSYPSLRQFVVTNGTAISGDMVREILRNRVSLRISIQAGDRDTWRAIHPKDDVRLFDRTQETIARLTAERDQAVELLYVICSKNCHAIGEMVNFALKNGVRRTLFRPMRLEIGEDGRFMNSHLMLAQHEYQAVVAQLVPLADTVRDRLDVNLNGFLGCRYDRELGRPSTAAFFHDHSCFIGWVMAVVFTDGRVVSCLEESFDRPMGSVYEKSLREIWWSEEYTRFRRQQLRCPSRRLDRTNCKTYCQHMGVNMKMNRILRLQPTLGPRRLLPEPA